MVGADGKDKDIVLLGMRDEVLSLDFSYMDERETELIMEFVHKVAYEELLSRSILNMTCDWSVRTETLLKRYRFELIRDIVNLTKNQVNNLHGCGYKTRKEIYEVFKSYGLDMLSWVPGYYYDKMNYKFTDEEVVSETNTHEM